jgi:hypothetical protein
MFYRLPKTIIGGADHVEFPGTGWSVLDLHCLESIPGRVIGVRFWPRIPAIRAGTVVRIGVVRLKTVNALRQIDWGICTSSKLTSNNIAALGSREFKYRRIECLIATL